MENIIRNYNEWLSRQNTDGMSIGLLDGQMGLCIYWYQQDRLYKDKGYGRLADELLDEVLLRVEKCPVFDFEEGILGIGFGILYLLEHKYVEGKANDILLELDEKIFQQLYFGHIAKVRKNTHELFNLTWGLLYLAQRMKCGMREIPDSSLYRGVLVKGVNALELSLRDVSIREPLCFSLTNYFTPIYVRLLTEMYRLNLYEDKIDMICKRLWEKLYSLTPCRMGNRMVLGSELESLVDCLGGKSFVCRFSSYIEMLSSGMDISKFLLHGFADRQLSIENGMAGMLLYLCSTHTLVNSTIDEKLLDEKIVSSSLWNNWRESHLWDESIRVDTSMYTGLSGIIFSYQRFMLGEKCQV